MPNERHTLTALVDNEAGVLARVVGLFSGRGYNIESLTVAEVDPKERTSRITIVTSGPPQVIEQIEAQLRRVVPVHAVTNWTFATGGIEREMTLVKVSGPDRAAAKEAAAKFRRPHPGRSRPGHRVRTHRCARQDFQLHRNHAATGTERCVAHRCRRHQPRCRLTRRLTCDKASTGIAPPGAYG